MRSQKPAPWRGNMFQGKDLAAWDVGNISRVLEQGTNPRASIEVVLRALNTLRRCVETASGSSEQMRVVLEHTSIVPVLYYWLKEKVEPGASGSRIKEHILYIFINLLGFSALYDETIVLDERFLADVVCALIVDENSVVASAGAQLVRRISELQHVVSALCFTEGVMSAMIEALSVAVELRENQCAQHLLSTFINLTGNEKAHFSLARNTHLTRVLVEIVQHGTDGDMNEVRLGTLAAKSLANLLYFPENVQGIRSDNEGLILSLVDCVRRCEGLEDNDLKALGTVCAIALDYCHDKGVEALEVVMRAEMQQSPASLPRITGW